MSLENDVFVQAQSLVDWILSAPSDSEAMRLLVQLRKDIDELTLAGLERQAYRLRQRGMTCGEISVIGECSSTNITRWVGNYAEQTGSPDLVRRRFVLDPDLAVVLSRPKNPDGTIRQRAAQARRKKRKRTAQATRAAD